MEESMKLKRILACLFIVAAFPLLASTARINSAHSAPFASVAFAGHVIGGGAYCTCGCGNCICDPGDVPMECNRSTPTPDNGKGTNQDGSPVGKGPTAELDFGTGALMLALAFFVWARLSRA